MSVFIGMNSLTSPIAGKLLDRAKINLLMGTGVIGFGISLLIIAFANNEWIMLLAVAFSGFSASFIGMLAPAKLMSNWFSRRRGIANGLCSLGVSGSGVVVPPVAGVLIGILTWNYTIVFYSAICIFIAAPIAYFLVVTRPSDVGQHQDNVKPLQIDDELHSTTDQSNDRLNTIQNLKTMDSKEILSSGIFWLNAVFFTCMFTCIPTTFSFIGSFFLHRGFDSMTPWLLSIMALFAMLGKVSFGYLADRFPIIVPLAGIPVFSALGFGLFLFSTTPQIVIFASICFGFGFGGIVTMNNFIYAKIFGMSMGNAMGLGRMTGAPFQILGPIITGVIIASTGSYVLIFTTLTALTALAMLSAIGIHLNLKRSSVIVKS